MRVIDSIQKWANVAPEHIAYVSGNRMLTYGELARRSDILADYFLGKFGTDTKLPIAICGHKEPELLIAFLASVKSGHPYVPIDVAIPEQRIDFILKASRALTLLTPSEIATLTEGKDSVAFDPAHYVADEDAFYIMFTSGSTGDPKGVVDPYENLQSFVDWMVREQQFIAQQEVFLDQAPFSFDLSIMDLFPCLVTGNILFSLRKEEVTNPAELYPALSKSQLTTWVSTPSFAQLCLTEKSFAEPMLPSLKRFLFCGETLSIDVAAALLERFPQTQVWNTYGPTEATVATTSVRIEKSALNTYPRLPVGYPKPDSQLLIMDEADNVLSEGQRGQIVIVGANVSSGYINRPDLTQKAFFDFAGERAYRAGDLGYMDHGLLFFEGRADNQIKLHGHRIELGDIEANLQALPHVRDALVVVKMKNTIPDSLTAFVIYYKQSDMSDAERTRLLRLQLAERLPEYMIPRRFYFLDSFPMTPNGKADRQKLAESQT